MTLQQIGEMYGTDKATYHHYCDFYEETLPKKITRLLEIGVKDGASLKMWRDYYPGAEIVGIDINKPLLIDGVTIIEKDATDVFALKFLGEFDIIIDDGNHYTKDQQISFNELFYNNLKKGGYYIMEDLHTSFYPSFRNSQVTTYKLLKDLFRNSIEWCRLPDYSDSLTMIIPK